MRHFLSAVGAVALALTTTAVQAQSDTERELLYPIGDERINWDGLEELSSGDHEGEVLTILGPWTGVDNNLFVSVLGYFEEATGIKVEYAGSESFEQQVLIDAQAGSAPNISVFPQPGLAADMASRGFLFPLGEETGEWIQENYAAGQSWVDLGTFTDNNGNPDLFGFFYKVDVKSLVWFVPENFEDAGYEVPQTMEELIALSDQIVADGATPWCIGLGSGGATGWPATDWVEDMMLRTQPPEVYDQWVAHDIPFNDPRVIEAIDTYGQFSRNDDYVSGGSNAVASIDFRESPLGLFESPPSCYLHRQASFIPSFFPDDIVIGVDADFFYFPAFVEKELGRPVLGGGTLFAITNDSPAARLFIDYLKLPVANEIWMAQTGFLTPHKGVNPEVYTDPTVRAMNNILLNATTFRFDGSDLMPGGIGAGAFWTGMVNYSSGDSSEDVATSIEETWKTLEN